MSMATALAKAITSSSNLCHRIFISSLISTNNNHNHMHTSNANCKTRLPELPMRPYSAYLRFLLKNREALMSSNPKMSSIELYKIMGEKWRQLPDNEKQIYIEAQTKELAVWKETKASIEAHLDKNNLLDDIKTKMAEERAERALRKAKISRNKLNQELDKPKKFVSPFFLFNMEFGKSLNDSNLKMLEKSKRASEVWNEMTDEAKEKYVQESVRQREKYRKDMEEWTKKLEGSQKAEELRKAEEKISRIQSRKHKLSTSSAKSEATAEE